MTSRTEKLVERVLDARRILCEESDLSPRNYKINEVLTALVYGITNFGGTLSEENEVLADGRVCMARPALLSRLAAAEGEMEKYWARMFCNRATLSPADMKEFIYWGFYERLVAGEARNLPRGMKMGPEQSIAFVGAGPLPLTAIMLHLRTGMKVTCIDIDPEACALAQDLCRKAGLTGVSVQCADGAAYDYKNNPAVFIASLVPQKEKVVERIRETRSSAFVALRSAERLHTLLYDPVDEETMISSGCAFLSRTAHDPDTINTTVFYRAASVPVQKPVRFPVSRP